MNPSWKTTTCGAIAIIGTAVVAADFGPMGAKIGGLMVSIGSGLGLMFARDNGVTSEQVIASKQKPSETACGPRPIMQIPPTDPQPPTTNPPTGN